MTEPENGTDAVKRIVIGSASDADMTIADLGAVHAVISRGRDDVWTIADRGSQPGTRVNGQRVTRHTLTSGDTITFGSISLSWPQDFSTAAGPTQLTKPNITRTPPNTSHHTLPPARYGTDRFLVGRAPTCDIVIDDPSVEPEHALLAQASNGTWTVSDRGSRSGTWVNGEQTARRRLTYDDIVTFGSVGLTWPHDFPKTLPAPVVSKATVGHQRPAVRLSSVDVSYPGSEFTALGNVTVTIARGDLVAIVGPSGSGKSTLCRAILGEIHVRHGEIYIDGSRQDIGSAPNPHQVSFVPQDSQMIDELTVRQTLKYATRVRGARGQSSAERDATAMQAIQTLSLDTVADQKVSRLSGGELKRLSIAQELITKPVVLLLDEPASGLDEGLDRSLIQELGGISASPEAPAVILVTHATNHLESVDSVCAVGAANSDAKTTARSTVRYFGPPEKILSSLSAPTYADAMNKLRQTSTQRALRERGAPFRHHFRSLTGHQPLMPLLHREYMRSQQRIGKMMSSLILIPFAIGTLLALIDPHGLRPNRFGANPNIQVTIALLVLLLTFWSLYKPTMRIVTDWPVIRREQRWGVSARLHLLSRLLWDLPQIVIVPTLTVFILCIYTRIRGQLPPISDLEALTCVLIATCITCYLVGLFIGAMNRTAVGAIQAVVGVIALQIVFSGSLFYLPDIRILDLISKTVPSRLAIAELSSILRIAPDPSAANTDPMFSSSEAALHWMFAGIILIGIAAGFATTVACTQTMRNIDRKR